MTFIVKLKILIINESHIKCEPLKQYITGEIEDY